MFTYWSGRDYVSVRAALGGGGGKLMVGIEAGSDRRVEMEAYENY